MGALQILHEAALLTLQRLGLTLRGAGGVALLYDLVRQPTRMQRKLFVRGEKLTLFLLQKPLGGEPRPPFLSQLLCDAGSTYAAVHHLGPAACLQPDRTA
jgi:hypothetical protein